LVIRVPLFRAVLKRSSSDSQFTGLQRRHPLCRYIDVEDWARNGIIRSTDGNGYVGAYNRREALAQSQLIAGSHMKDDDLRNLVINVIAGAVLFVLGVLSRRLFALWQGMTVGRFWRRLAQRGLTIVVGQLDRQDFLAYEPSGVVGVGDVRALDDLNEVFRRGRLRRFGIAFGGALNDNQRKGNLVLLGGIDGNPLSANLMQEVGSCIELMNEDQIHPPVLLDHISDPPLRLQPDIVNGRVMHDYGVLIRARNPHEPNNWIVIIAGCLGYATWAGVHLAQTAEISHAPLEFECVYRVQADSGAPTQLAIITGARRLERK
jgi:hypothetical protein